MKYVAFLRGINVGGHKPVRMADLRAAFERMGFSNVRTILASGNVIFDGLPTAAATNSETMSESTGLAAYIERGLQDAFGHVISVTVRTPAELRRLVNANPFSGVTRSPDTRLYITFLSRPVGSARDFAYDSPAGDMTIRMISSSEVASTVVLSSRMGTTDLMVILDREFGNTVTTRNWDTIMKVVALF